LLRLTFVVQSLVRFFDCVRHLVFALFFLDFVWFPPFSFIQLFVAAVWLPPSDFIQLVPDYLLNPVFAFIQLLPVSVLLLASFKSTAPE
jgi:hypothetical protein